MSEQGDDLLYTLQSLRAAIRPTSDWVIVASPDTFAALKRLLPDGDHLLDVHVSELVEPGSLWKVKPHVLFPPQTFEWAPYGFDFAFDADDALE